MQEFIHLHSLHLLHCRLATMLTLVMVKAPSTQIDGPWATTASARQCMLLPVCLDVQAKWALALEIPDGIELPVPGGRVVHSVDIADPDLRSTNVEWHHLIV